MSDRDDAIAVAKDVIKEGRWATALYQIAEAFIAEVEAHDLSQSLSEAIGRELVSARTRISELEAKIRDLGSEYAIVCHWRYQVEIAKEALEKIYIETDIWAGSEENSQESGSLAWHIAKKALK